MGGPPSIAAAARHLVVGTPCYGGTVSTLYMASVMRLQRLCLERGVAFELKLLGGDALVTRARNSIVTSFLDTPAATHLLFIDADIGFEAEAVFRMLAFDVDLVAGLYPTKTIDWPAFRQLADRGHPDPRAAAMQYVVEFPDPARIERVGDFARATAVGTGFMLIGRRVFTQLAAGFPALRYRKVNVTPDPQRGSDNRYAFFEGMIDADGYYLPEDYTFCRRWCSLGGAIWVDLASRLTHIGPYGFQGDASAIFAARPPDPTA